MSELEMMREADLLLPRIGVCLGLLLHLVAILFNVRRIVHGNAVNNWKRTAATVTDGKFDDTRRGWERLTSSHNSPLGWIEQNRFVPTFEYRVGNRKYTSQKLLRDDTLTFMKSYTEKKMDKYLDNREVEIYYNPEDHSEAVLEPGINPVVWWRIAGYFLMFCVILTVALYFGIF